MIKKLKLKWAGLSDWDREDYKFKMRGIGYIAIFIGVVSLIIQFCGV